jgi:hypothetical protein
VTAKGYLVEAGAEHGQGLVAIAWPCRWLSDLLIHHMECRLTENMGPLGFAAEKTAAVRADMDYQKNF